MNPSSISTKSNSSNANLLGGVPLFSNLSLENLALLFQHAICRHYPKNTLIISEGDHTDSLYIIQKGRVKVFLTNRSGSEVTLSISREGAYFGELSFLDNEPRSASVITMEPCVVYVFSKSDFQKCLNDNAQISISLMQDLSGLVRSLTSNVKNLALNTVYRRLVNIWLKMSQKENGILIIKEKLTQQEMANMVGSSREMVNKIVNDLIASGYICKDKKHIIILKELPTDWQIK